ncbi:MAG: hypothetical protein HYS09_02155 [Chloroflexi bacterium]|nr:hypothetical protein [Chloroflexota bacterium]
MKTRSRWGMPLLLLPVALLALAMLAAACGGGGEEGAEEEGEGEEEEFFLDPNAPVVDVALDEWSVTPTVTAGEAGGITFSATNNGGSDHELVIIKTDTPADELSVTGGKVDEEAAGEVIGEIEEFAAGETVAGTFDLAPGKYALICNIAAHYEQGMHAAFTVE